MAGSDTQYIPSFYRPCNISGLARVQLVLELHLTMTDTALYDRYKDPLSQVMNVCDLGHIIAVGTFSCWTTYSYKTGRIGH